MISHTTQNFRKMYADLSKDVHEQSKKAYAKFKKDPYHPSLFFKRVHSTKPIFSVRVTKDYRSVGVLKENEIIWFWIGNHSDYDKLLKQV